MAKFEKEKKDKKNYKYLSDVEVEETNKMSNAQLLKEYLVQNRALRQINKLKKEDPVISELKSKIKTHRETTVSDKTLAEVKKLKDRLKEIKEEIDVGIEEEKEALKEKNNDYKEDKGFAKEKLKLVQLLLDKRGE